MSVYIGKGVLAEGVYDESCGLGFCRHEHPVVLFDNPIVVFKSSGVVEGGFHEVAIVELHPANFTNWVFVGVGHCEFGHRRICSRLDEPPFEVCRVIESEETGRCGWGTAEVPLWLTIVEGVVKEPAVACEGTAAACGADVWQVEAVWVCVGASLPGDDVGVVVAKRPFVHTGAYAGDIVAGCFNEAAVEIDGKMTACCGDEIEFIGVSLSVLGLQ